MTLPIKIFIHIHDLPGSFELMSEQLSLVSETGLMDEADEIILCANGRESSFNSAKEALADFENVTFAHVNENAAKWEYPTLNYIKQVCDTVEEDFAVLYFHLKGLSRLGDQRVQDWRKYMEYWMIERWQECVDKLENNYDLVGTNIIEQPWLHSSGNFWWSKSSYIKKLNPLPDPTSLNWGSVSPYTGATYDQGNFRYDHEAWIATANPTWFEIDSSPGKQEPGWHFKNAYPREKYATADETSTVED